MSGLYNMVMGRNPEFPILAAAVGITQEFATEHPLGRVRDAWIEPDGETICILHRNYGAEGEPFHASAKLLPTFRRNVEASDPTYGWWEFEVPKDRPDIREVISLLAKHTDTSNRWQKYVDLIADLGKDVDSPDTRRAKEVGKKIFAGLGYAEKEGIAEVQHGEGGVVIEQPGEDPPEDKKA